MSWPRSVTEKLLSDMFEGSAAQFLAILEALSSSHRRTFHNAPYSNESEMVEVASELFIAGKEIIAGSLRNLSEIKSSSYSRYYAEACNEQRGPSPRLSAWATQLQRNDAAVASRWRQCVRFDHSANRTQDSRTDSNALNYFAKSPVSW